RLEIHGRLQAGQLLLEVHPLLDELQPRERIGVIDRLADDLQPPTDGFGRALAAAARLVSLERFEVVAHRPSLGSADGEGGLVVVRHGGSALLGRAHVAHSYPLPSVTPHLPGAAGGTAGRPVYGGVRG